MFGPLRSRWRGIRRRWRALIWLVGWLTVLIALAVVASYDEDLGGALLFGFFAGTLIIGLARAADALLRRRARSRTIRPIRHARSEQPFRPGQRVWQRPRGLRWLWSGGTVTLDSSESREELVDRLRDSVRRERIVDTVLPRGQLIGWVANERIQVTANIPLLYNAFNSVLEGEIVAEPSGARVAGVLRLRRAVLGLMVVWLAFATMLGIVVFVTTLVTPMHWHPSPPPAFVGPLFPVFGVVVLAAGRAFALPQEQLLVNRLEAAISDPPK